MMAAKLPSGLRTTRDILRKYKYSCKLLDSVPYVDVRDALDEFNVYVESTRVSTPAEQSLRRKQTKAVSASKKESSRHEAIPAKKHIEESPRRSQRTPVPSSKFSANSSSDAQFTSGGKRKLKQRHSAKKIDKRKAKKRMSLRRKLAKSIVESDEEEEILVLVEDDDKTNETVLDDENEQSSKELTDSDHINDDSTVDMPEETKMRTTRLSVKAKDEALEENRKLSSKSSKHITKKRTGRDVTFNGEEDEGDKDEEASDTGKRTSGRISAKSKAKKRELRSNSAKETPKKVIEIESSTAFCDLSEDIPDKENEDESATSRRTRSTDGQSKRKRSATSEQTAKKKLKKFETSIEDDVELKLSTKKKRVIVDSDDEEVIEPPEIQQTEDPNESEMAQVEEIYDDLEELGEGRGVDEDDEAQNVDCSQESSQDAEESNAAAAECADEPPSGEEEVTTNGYPKSDNEQANAANSPAGNASSDEEVAARPKATFTPDELFDMMLTNVDASGGKGEKVSETCAESARPPDEEESTHEGKSPESNTSNADLKCDPPLSQDKENRNAMNVADSKRKCKDKRKTLFKIRFKKFVPHVCSRCHQAFEKNVDLQVHVLRHFDKRQVRVRVFNASLPKKTFATTKENIDTYLRPRRRRSTIDVHNIGELKSLLGKYANKRKLKPFDKFIKGDYIQGEDSGSSGNSSIRSRNCSPNTKPPPEVIEIDDDADSVEVEIGSLDGRSENSITQTKERSPETDSLFSLTLVDDDTANTSNSQKQSERKSDDRISTADTEVYDFDELCLSIDCDPDSTGSTLKSDKTRTSKTAEKKSGEQNSTNTENEGNCNLLSNSEEPRQLSPNDIFFISDDGDESVAPKTIAKEQNDSSLEEFHSAREDISSPEITRPRSETAFAVKRLRNEETANKNGSSDDLDFNLCSDDLRISPNSTFSAASDLLTNECLTKLSDLDKQVENLVIGRRM